MPRTYTAKDPRLNQKVSLSSHVLDTKRKVGRSSLSGDCLTAHCAAGDVLLAAQGRLQLLDVDVPLDQGISQLPCHHRSHITPVQEGKEPEAGKRPYTIQYSMKPTSAKMYHTVVQKYSNIILGG